MENQLGSLTKTLLELLEKGRIQFEESKSSGKEGDFYSEVKPFADLVKTTCDEWLPIAIQWIQIDKPPFINKKQLETTYEHLEKMGIQAFYPTTSRKHFISSLQSAQFVLQSILQYLEKNT
ncbi:YppE family protein [Neobacillus sp. D3-1R]|uniref:YppE family protein n=1 Tax=Neobacillus sp. D3-1R TaxID=3445778 RepID=UPI003F9EF915